MLSGTVDENLPVCIIEFVNDCHFEVVFDINIREEEKKDG